MAEAEKNLWRSSGPHPVLKQGHPELIAYTYVQKAFDYLQRWWIFLIPFVIFGGDFISLDIFPL